MKTGLSILLVTVTGFLCLSLGDPVRQNRITWGEVFPFSVEKERDLGEKVFEEIQRRMEIIQVPSIQEYVNGLGRNLIANADASQFPIRFFILREPEPNAFAIPGGKIFLTSGLIGLVESDDELVGVMGHELAHVVRRHIAQNIEASQRMSIATLAGILAGILVGGSEGGAIMTGSLALGEAKKLEYTRENESEADRLGLAYMIKAGYDGWAMVTFLRKIHRKTHLGRAFPSYLVTHPGVPTRISYLETLIGGPPDSIPLSRLSDGLRHTHLRLFIDERGPLESLNHFDNLLKLRPDDGYALFGRALAEKEMGRVKESIEDLKRVHTLNPGDSRMLKELGLAFIRIGRINEGVRALERSLLLSENDAEALQYLAQGYQAQKRLDLAIESYLKARELNPDLPELDRNLGSAYKEKGEVGRSHLYYGFYFKKRGKEKYARFHFERALELSGQDPQAREEVTRELHQLKR